MIKWSTGCRKRRESNGSVAGNRGKSSYTSRWGNTNFAVVSFAIDFCQLPKGNDVKASGEVIKWSAEC